MSVNWLLMHLIAAMWNMVDFFIALNVVLAQLNSPEHVDIKMLELESSCNINSRHYCRIIKPHHSLFFKLITVMSDG